jgi:two-component system, NarL family, nitrate/nitrite response regulator NarL
MIGIIRIAVVEDHPLFREGVTRSLSEIGGFEIVDEGATAQDAERIASTVRPDITAGHLAAGAAAWTRLRASLPTIPLRRSSC